MALPHLNLISVMQSWMFVMLLVVILKDSVSLMVGRVCLCPGPCVFSRLFSFCEGKLTNCCSTRTCGQTFGSPGLSYHAQVEPVGVLDNFEAHVQHGGQSWSSVSLL